MSTHRYVRLVSVLAVTTALTTSSVAQTKVTPPPNKYTVAQDVQLGQEAAAEARKELPMLTDDRVDDYVERVGARLVAGIPPEFRQPQFRYTFDVVNQKEINAFALPGGPMFLNRGMIEAAKSEAEMAGVMAHEISHVALRHGTAQAGNTTLPGLVGVGGQILGGILGGTLGNVIGLGSQIGAQAWVTKYSREYETQADILGAQILARAGYDPRQMANMFKTIEAQGGGGGPEFLSSHPNPGNRFEAINREAASLRVNNPTVNTQEFTNVKARLTGMAPARSAREASQRQSENTGGPVGTSGRTVRVEAPSNQYRTYTPAEFLRVAVPANWSQRGGGEGGVTFTPEGGWFEGNGGTAFTHGVQLGVLQGGSGDLQRDTEQLLQSFARSNPQLRRAGNYQRATVGGRQGLTATLSNVSEVTGQQEYVNLSTTHLRDGSVLFMIGVAPQSEARTYANAFAKVRQNMQIADR